MPGTWDAMINKIQLDPAHKELGLVERIGINQIIKILIPTNLRLLLWPVVQVKVSDYI